MDYQDKLAVIAAIFAGAGIMRGRVLEPALLDEAVKQAVVLCQKVETL